MSKAFLLPGVPADLVLSALAKAPGKELESGKFKSPESSSALAANAFGWFIERPHLLPQLPNAPPVHDIEAIHLEYCARFPWAGGHHPWLDALIETPQQIVGVESKRFEPFRDKKVGTLSAAYDRHVWGNGMQPFEHMRDVLREEPARFKFLNAVQLVKHAFGLVTDAKRNLKSPHLHYLFAEPAARGDKAISLADLQVHRREVDHFTKQVAGADVTFSACSYREWLAQWHGNQDVEAHAAELMSEFAP